jgi:group I intron endonuclease
MVVYITTNLINGKKYIGSDSNNNPSYYGSGVSLIKSIKKYGKENFKKEILAETDDYSLMRELEEYYIYYYSASKSPLFYNRSDKGVGQGCGDMHWNYGKTLSKNTKDKKSKSMKGKSIHTKKSKKNISTKLKGKKSPMKGKTNPNSGRKTNYKLYQYDLKGNLLNTFNSPQEAFEQTGVNKRSILNVINPNHYSKTCYGFIWSKNILT